MFEFQIKEVHPEILEDLTEISVIRNLKIVCAKKFELVDVGLAVELSFQEKFSDVQFYLT